MSVNENHSKYAIFQCNKCTRWIYARAAQKSSKCGFCQHQNKVPEKPKYSTDKPTNALIKIKELNATNHPMTNDRLEFQSKGKYKPVKIEMKKNVEVNSEQRKNENKHSKKNEDKHSKNENMKISESTNNNVLSQLLIKATKALKDFQINMRIEQSKGIPLNTIPMIFKNAGIASTSTQKIIDLLLQKRIIEYTNNKSAIFVI